MTFYLHWILLKSLKFLAYMGSSIMSWDSWVSPVIGWLWATWLAFTF